LKPALGAAKCVNFEHDWVCWSSMDSSIIAAASAIFGSIIGGLTLS
jgi:hypothetical protein